MRISDWSSDVCSSDLGAHRDEIGGSALQFARVFDQDDAIAAPGDLGEQRVGERRLPSAGPARDKDIEAIANSGAQNLRLVGKHDAGRDIVFEREDRDRGFRSEEHTSELQSLMRISYAVFCLKKKITTHIANKQ